jgi:hypothetical protein
MLLRQHRYGLAHAARSTVVWRRVEDIDDLGGSKPRRRDRCWARSAGQTADTHQYEERCMVRFLGRKYGD